MQQLQGLSRDIPNGAPYFYNFKQVVQKLILNLQLMQN